METGNRTDAKNDPAFYRCKSVWLCGDTMKWELDSASPYKPMEAYKDAPHRQFMQASDDSAIEAFVRAWGPLWIDGGDSPGESSLPKIRKERDTLIAWAELFAALKKSDYLRDAVIALLRLDPDPHSIAIRPCVGLPIKSEATLSLELEDRLRTAPKVQIAYVCDYLVEAFPTFGQTLRIARTRKEASVQATMRFLSLSFALYWMVWQDIFEDKPFVFCGVCGRLINSNSRHKRKFCDARDDSCAKKHADGDYKKEKRKDPVWVKKQNDMRNLRYQAKTRAAKESLTKER
jgi:hypothetical protein